ncbi:hypothetical protein [Nocardioides ultimimeridianus]
MRMVSGVRRGLVVVALAVALPLTLTGCGSDPGRGTLQLEGGGGASSYRPPRIRMVQANLRIGTPVRKFQADVRHVLSTHPDFVTYDEVARRHDGVLAPGPYRLWRQGGIYRGEAAVAWNSDRWHLRDHGVTMLTDRTGRVPGARYAWGRRYANWVTLRSNGGLTLSVIAAHFPPDTRITRGLTAPAARRLGRLADRLAHRGSVVVGGDLNVGYNSPSYPRMILRRHGLIATYDALERRLVTSGRHVTIDYVLVRGFARFSLGDQFSLGLNSDHNAVGVDLGPLPARIGPSMVRFGDGTVLSDPSGPVRDRHVIVRMALKAIRSAKPGAAVHLAVRALGSPAVVRSLRAAYRRGVHVQVISGSRSSRGFARLARLLGGDVGSKSWAVYRPDGFAMMAPTVLLVSRSGATPAFRLTAQASVGRATNRGWHRAYLSTTKQQYDNSFRSFFAAARR